MAITIDEIRTKYPQYNDLSDQDLADKLHAKYYSDMDKGDFYNKVDLKETKESIPEKKQDLRNILDIQNVIPKDVTSTKYNLEPAKRFIEGVTKSTAPFTKKLYDIDTAIQYGGKVSPTGQLFKVIGESAPYIAGAELGGGVGALGRAIPYVGRALPFAGRVAGSSLVGREEFPQNQGLGTIVGALGEIVPSGIAKTAQYGIKKFPSIAEKGLYPYLKSYMNDFMENMKGNEKDDIISKLYDESKTYFKELRGDDLANKEYKYVNPDNSFAKRYLDLNAIAKSKGIQFDRSTLDDVLNNKIKLLNRKLSKEGEDSVFSDKIKSELKDLNSIKNKRFIDFKDVSNAKKDIDELIKKKLIQGDSIEHLSDIEDALLGSEEKTVQGIPELEGKWKELRKDYKEKIIPFKYLPGSKSPSTFMKLLHTGEENVDSFKRYLTPETGKIPRLYKMLPNQELKNLATYQYFSKAEGDISKQMNLLSKLSPDDRKAMFGNEVGPFKDLENLYSRTKEPFKEPKGFMKKIGASFPEILAAVALNSFGHPHLGITSLAAPIGVYGASKLALKNKNIRDAIIKGSIDHLVSRITPSELTRRTVGDLLKGALPAETVEFLNEE